MKIYDVAEWIHIADEDLKEAEDSLPKFNRSNHTICFHCSRSVEKYLKAYLIYNDIIPDKSHNLEDLNNECSNIDENFGLLKTGCNILKEYPVKQQYPKREMLYNDAVDYAIKFTNYVKSFKPIQSIRDEVIKTYGNNWRNDLFNNIVSQIEIKPSEVHKIDCFKYDNVYNSNITLLLKDLADVKYLETIDNNIIKSSYTNKVNIKVYVLERTNADNSTQIWQFHGDFDKSSALNFIKLFDEQYNS